MSERIPDEHAQILWNESGEGRIMEVCIIDYRDASLQNKIANRYDNDNGASTSDWLSDIRPIANPGGLFAYLAFRCGFESRAVGTECLREFAQLRSAEWARQMLAEMERSEW